MDDATLLIGMLAALHRQRMLFAERALRLEVEARTLRAERDGWRDKAQTAERRGYERGRKARRRV